MSFTLNIDADRWRAHQASVVTAVSATGAGEIVPVIKGSGYGLGQRALAEEASRLDLGTVAVGTVFELGDMLDSYSGEIIVLQPFEVRDMAAADAWHFLADRGHRVIRTISSTEALLALADGPGPVRVILEGRTSMQRFGFTHDELLAALADSRVRAALANPADRVEAVRRFARAYQGSATDQQALQTSAQRALETFADGGLQAISRFLETNVPPAGRNLAVPAGYSRWSMPGT
jgi:hypothetical protein